MQTPHQRMVKHEPASHFVDDFDDSIVWVGGLEERSCEVNVAKAIVAD